MLALGLAARKWVKTSSCDADKQVVVDTYYLQQKETTSQKFLSR